MERSEAILEFWFGPRTQLEANRVPDEKIAMWFSGGPELDEEISERFGEDLQRAGRGEYDHWAKLPYGRLALIVTLDQFSRNIHRGSPRAFAYDDQALSFALDGIDDGHDQQLPLFGRTFLYMPLEHSEELGHQERCVQLMEELVEEAPIGQRALFEGALEYAEKHRDIIAEFGRFPHRNPILDRESTAEEIAYLENSGSTFGQTANSD